MYFDKKLVLCLKKKNNLNLIKWMQNVATLSNGEVVLFSSGIILLTLFLLQFFLLILQIFTLTKYLK